MMAGVAVSVLSKKPSSGTFMPIFSNNAPIGPVGDIIFEYTLTKTMPDMMAGRKKMTRNDEKKGFDEIQSMFTRPATLPDIFTPLPFFLTIRIF